MLYSTDILHEMAGIGHHHYGILAQILYAITLSLRNFAVRLTFTKVLESLTIEYLYTHFRYGIRAPIPQTRGVLVEEDLPPSELLINKKKHFYYIHRADFAF